MVSSRRLAREWALKILYQMDVGKVSVQEARDTALERLRMEFVQRGSRTASGSPVEQALLDMFTAELKDTLPTARVPFEQAVAQIIAFTLQEAPYWQELRFEKSFRSQLAGMRLNPPRLLTPTPYLPTTAQGDEQNGLVAALEALSPEERARLVSLADRLKNDLPRLLDPDLRQRSRDFVRGLKRELVLERPVGTPPAQTEALLLERRREFNDASASRWVKIARTVQKQTVDFLRVGAFARTLVDGMQSHRGEIDTALRELSSGWSLERQVSVDRNILRLAAYEMLFVPGIPTSASINEAVELAKKYSTAESGRFVNGVLGALAARTGDKLSTQPPEDESLVPDEMVDLPDIPDLEELAAE